MELLKIYLIGAVLAIDWSMLASLQNENVGGFEDLLFRSEVREGTSTIMNPLLVEASVGPE